MRVLISSDCFSVWCVTPPPVCLTHTLDSVTSMILFDYPHQVPWDPMAEPHVMAVDHLFPTCLNLIKSEILCHLIVLWSHYLLAAWGHNATHSIYVSSLGLLRRPVLPDREQECEFQLMLMAYVTTSFPVPIHMLKSPLVLSEQVSQKSPF